MSHTAEVKVKEVRKYKVPYDSGIFGISSNYLKDALEFTDAELERFLLQLYDHNRDDAMAAKDRILKLCERYRIN